jgi:cellulose synthase/poly-beta-1,6-N-acetylglucosamine synthase-like glycosyltransferase
MTQAIVIVFFWISIALIIYVYVGYPLLIDLMARIRPRPVHGCGQAAEPPLVTVIIPAHNEERWMARKIESSLALDYPHDRMQILVASDGSTDKTVEI